METKLIEQLKQTPKWGEFEKWWNHNYEEPYGKSLDVIEVYLYVNHYPTTISVGFYAWCDFPFEFQSGVLLKFVEERCKFITYEHGFIWININESSERFNTIEELILWYFNQKQL
jgi:hypothetical protein